MKGEQEMKQQPTIRVSSVSFGVLTGTLAVEPIPSDMTLGKSYSLFEGGDWYIWGNTAFRGVPCDKCHEHSFEGHDDEPPYFCCAVDDCLAIYPGRSECTQCIGGVVPNDGKIGHPFNAMGRWSMLRLDGFGV